MREIKFRAWDKVTEKMYLVWDIGFKAWDGEDSIINYIRICPDGTEDRFENQVELMQYTGLSDKNGKEIWEGDLVQTKMDGKNVICEVIFQEGYFALKLTSPDPTDYRKYIGIMYGANPYGEVIGNIYESPTAI